jgi:T5orf172 domain
MARTIIYAIGPQDSSHAKIGHTGNLVTRMDQLQRGSSEPLEVIFLVQAAKSLESVLHDCFKPFRTHGEWFDFGEYDRHAMIKAVLEKIEGREVSEAAASWTAEVKKSFEQLEELCGQREQQRLALRSAIAEEMLRNPEATTRALAAYTPWSEETIRQISREFKVPRKRPPTVRSIKDKPES